MDEVRAGDAQVLGDRRPGLAPELGQAAAPVVDLELVVLATVLPGAVEPGRGAVAAAADDVRSGEEEGGAARLAAPAGTRDEEVVELRRRLLVAAPPLQAEGGEEGGGGILPGRAREIGAAEVGGGCFPVPQELV